MESLATVGSESISRYRQALGWGSKPLVDSSFHPFPITSSNGQQRSKHEFEGSSSNNTKATNLQKKSNFYYKSELFPSMVIQIIQITQVQSFELLSFTHVTVHAISRLQNKVTKVQINFYKKKKRKTLILVIFNLEPNPENHPSFLGWNRNTVSDHSLDQIQLLFLVNFPCSCSASQ